MTIDDQIGSKSQPLPQIFPPPPVAGWSQLEVPPPANPVGWHQLSTAPGAGTERHRLQGGFWPHFFWIWHAMGYYFVDYYIDEIFGIWDDRFGDIIWYDDVWYTPQIWFENSGGLFLGLWHSSCLARSDSLRNPRDSNVVHKPSKLSGVFWYPFHGQRIISFWSRDVSNYVLNEPDLAQCCIRVFWHLFHHISS